MTQWESDALPSQCTKAELDLKRERAYGDGRVKISRCQRAPTHCRFEIEIEPIFGILALYDVREKKKVGAPSFPFLPPALLPCCRVMVFLGVVAQLFLVPLDLREFLL